MEQNKLQAILTDHKKWVESDHDRGGHADLSGADLRGADLRYANLRDADLSGADLRGADLRYANLCDANLRYADLGGAHLGGANLCDANLRDANLGGAHLCGADLRGARLRYANLRYADLCDAKDIPHTAAAKLLACPEEGEFTAWKACSDGVLVKIKIPSNARRSSATGRKCRAEFAEVLEVVGAEAGVSKHDGSTIYRAGETVRCDNWDQDRWNECSGGIHFFITRAEAEEWL